MQNGLRKSTGIELVYIIKYAVSVKFSNGLIDIEEPEKLQMRANKLVRSISNLSYGDKL
jgi:hypothetical protein